jgi:hypothetical protein
MLLKSVTIAIADSAVTVVLLSLHEQQAVQLKN